MVKVRLTVRTERQKAKPAKRRSTERRAPNGAFVETILEVVADRLRWYQSSAFASEYNAAALASIEEALAALRTPRQIVRRVVSKERTEHE